MKRWGGILILGFVILGFLSVSSASAATFERILSLGSQGEDVSELQRILKDKGFFTFPTITGYFGPATLEAVKKFQLANNIEAVGFTGPATRSLLNKSKDLTQTTSLPQSLDIGRDLYLGYQGADVSELQQFLKDLGYFTHPVITGYFGPLTKEAVVRFQNNFNITPTGNIGPITASKIREISNTTESSTSEENNEENENSEDEDNEEKERLDYGRSKGVTVKAGGSGSNNKDTTPPSVSSVSSGTPAATSVTITWNTNEAANSQVNYGTTSSYGSSASGSGFTTNHSVNITSLLGETTYHFQVVSVDSAGNASSSSDATFVTASPYSAEANAFFARLSTQPTTERKVLYDNLITDLVDADIWENLDALYVFAAADTATSLINLVSSSFTATKDASAPFTADRGYTGVGLSGYAIDSNFNPTTANGNYSQNSATAFIWNNSYQNSNQEVMGTTAGFDKLELYTRCCGGARYHRFNDDSEISETTSDGSGLTALDRSASGSYNIYQQGILRKNRTVTSTGIPNNDITFIGANSSPVISVGGFGGSLTAEQHSILSESLKTYLDEVGVDVRTASQILSPSNMVVAEEDFAVGAVETTIFRYNGQLYTISFESPLKIRNYPSGTLVASLPWNNGGIYGSAIVVGDDIHIFGSDYNNRRIVHSVLENGFNTPTASEIIYTDAELMANSSVVSSPDGYIMAIERLVSPQEIFFLQSDDLETWIPFGETYDRGEYLGCAKLYYTAGAYYINHCIAQQNTTYQSIAKSEDGLETFTTYTGNNALIFPEFDYGTTSGINASDLVLIEDGGDVKGVFLDGDQLGTANIRRVTYTNTTLEQLFEAFFP